VSAKCGRLPETVYGGAAELVLPDGRHGEPRDSGGTDSKRPCMSAQYLIEERKRLNDGARGP
jgi:hypothetical protein